MSAHPLAIDLCEFVDGQPVDHRPLLAHIAVCEPCRRGLINIIQSSDGYPDLFDRQDGESETPKARTLFLALTVPGVSDDADPDDVADHIARMANLDVKRLLAERVMVNAIPSPQWLTAKTLANLRAAATGGTEAGS